MNDHAALNVGQLKTLAFAAFEELSTAPAAPPGPAIEALVKSWVQTTPSGAIVPHPTTGRPLPRLNVDTADYAAVNVGQLKTVAKPFYDYLISIGYADRYPWDETAQPGDDFAIANVGQAKTLFAFDVRRDTDGDNIPDWWETRHGKDPANPQDARSTTIFWGVRDADAYALGFSRTAEGDARHSPTRPQLPNPPSVTPPPPATSPTGSILPQVTLTAKRQRTTSLRRTDTYKFPQIDDGVNTPVYYRIDPVTYTSTDPWHSSPGFALNSDADISGNRFDEGDPRDYGFDADVDDGLDQDGNGDPDDGPLDQFPSQVSTVVDYAEWNENRMNPRYYGPQDPIHLIDDESEPPTAEGKSILSAKSLDRWQPASRIETDGYFPLTVFDALAALSAVPYGSSDQLGWEASGPSGVANYIATSRWYPKSNSQIIWTDPNPPPAPPDAADPDPGPQVFTSVSESMNLESVQFRAQSNIAFPPGRQREQSFAIYRSTGTIGQTQTSTCLGVITLIFDPGRMVATRFRATPGLESMVTTVNGAVTIKLEPVPLWENTVVSLGAYAGPVIEVDYAMPGVVGDVIPSVRPVDGQKHFVSPKKTAEIPHDYVTFTAKGITVAEFNNRFRWDTGTSDGGTIAGEPVPGDPLSYRVPRTAAGICRVKIVTQEGFFMVDQFNVWVVWATSGLPHRLTATVFKEDAPAPAQNGQPPKPGRATWGSGNMNSWRFVFTIEPASIIGTPDQDFPDLRGVNRRPVPGASKPHPAGIPKAADEAQLKWDVSRQISGNIRWQRAFALVPVARPLDDTEGNDDEFGHPDDENDFPYAAFEEIESLAHPRGAISSTDGPVFFVSNKPGPIGETFTQVLNLWEFARVELWNGKRTGGKDWYRISDFVQWHHVMKAKLDRTFPVLGPVRWMNIDSASGIGPFNP